MEFIPAKRIISGYVKDNAWFGNNYNMNIYKGCCHGCIDCDSRSECYGVYNFDEVKAKDDVLALIGRALKSKGRSGIVYHVVPYVDIVAHSDVLPTTL